MTDSVLPFLPRVSSFIQPSLTPATLAAGLQTLQVLAGDSLAENGTTWSYSKYEHTVLIKLQAGDQDSESKYILLPPSGGTCVALAPLVSAIPGHIPVYGLEHPRHSTSSGQQDASSVEHLARLYADAVRNHLGTVKSKKTIIVGASFGGVVATEMFLRLSSSPDGSSILKNVQLVLLDAPIAGYSAVSGFSRANGHHTQAEAVGIHGNGSHTIDQSAFQEDHPTEAVHRESIQALRKYSGPGEIAPKSIQALYVAARGEKSGEAGLIEKKCWWTHIFPEMRWEELQSTHEDLWQAKSIDVLKFVQG